MSIAAAIALASNALPASASLMTGSSLKYPTLFRATASATFSVVARPPIVPDAFPAERRAGSERRQRQAGDERDAGSGDSRHWFDLLGVWIDDLCLVERHPRAGRDAAP